MATAFTNADQVGLYLTSAGGATATGTPLQSLGGMRTGTQVRQVDALISGQLSSVIVEQIGGYLGEGTAYVSGATTTALALTPVSGSAGSNVTTADGAVVLLEGSTANGYVRVRRDGSASLGDALTLDVKKVYNGAIGMGNVSTTDSASGKSYYRGLMVRNHGGTTLSNIYIYLKTLGTQRATGTAQLGASGSGTITTATASGFADWPSQGWARIVTSGAVLREVVYYTSRTATSLTVPSAGRGRLGTSAAAGAATDTVDAIPGVRVGIEACGASGTIQSIANENTAPTGITWYTGTTTATGATIASLTADTNYGLWIHREIPAGATGYYRYETAINVAWSTYNQVYYGLYRVAQSSLAKYNLYAGVDAFPTFTSATSSSATLSFTYALSAPVSGTRRHRIVVRQVDAYGISSFNTLPHDITVNSSGANVTAEVSTPTEISLANTAGGYVRLRAKYATGVDSSDADTFKYYVTTDGTTPTTAGTAVTVTMTVGQGLSASRALNVLLGPYSYGTDLRVLVTAYRTSDSKQSTNTTATTTTVNTVGPPAPAMPSAGYSGLVGIDTQWGYTRAVEYLNSPTNTVYLRTYPGVTELWSGSTMILRAICGPDGTAPIYFPSTFALVNSTISGAGAATAFQVVSANEIYICVASTRRLKIDVSALTITADTFNTEAAVLSADIPTIGPSFVGAAATSLQVYDPAIGKWRTALSVSSAGVATAQFIKQGTT